MVLCVHLWLSLGPWCVWAVNPQQGPPLSGKLLTFLFWGENYSYGDLGTGALSSNTCSALFRSPLGSTALLLSSGSGLQLFRLPAKDPSVYASRGGGLRCEEWAHTLFHYSWLALACPYSGWRGTPVTYECPQHTVWHVTCPQESPSKVDRKLASCTWALVDTFWPNFCFLRELYLGNEL